MASFTSPEIIIEEAREIAKKIIETAEAIVETISEAVRDSTFPTSTIIPKLPSLAALSVTRDFFHHSSYIIKEWLPSLALDYFWLLEIKNPFTLFRDPNLNLAASYIRHFNLTSMTHDWLHVMVKAASFESFLEAMNEDRGLTRTLAFSCWCDGGIYEDMWYCQHRHFIVVAPKNHFYKRVWPRVKEFPEIPCKGKKEITKPFHLMNLLGYLSKEKSRCEFTTKTTKQYPVQKKHFYIFKTLPVGFRKPLATQWDNGIFQVLYLETFQKEMINDLDDKRLIFENSQWKIKISDLKNIDRDVVLPVAKEYSPTRRETSHFIYLTHGQKLYFEIDPDNKNLSEQEWLQKQVKGGNAFYNVIENEKYFPPAECQKQLNYLMPRIEKIKELEKENAYLKQKLNEKRT